MAEMETLPNELLNMIFQHLASAELRQEGSCDVELPAVPSSALFPLNVASVCTLWFDILRSHPQYWQRIVIDVAADPAPFLDTFTRFQDDANTPLDIIVFSSMPNIDWELENSRADVVFKHLKAVITRCATITFRLVYQSSLPSAGNILIRDPPLNLTHLFLTCTVHDLDGEENMLVIEDLPSTLGSVILPELRNLSLTGLDFVDLYRGGTILIHQEHLQLSIDHFTFRKIEFEGHEIFQSATFWMLMTAVEDISRGTTLRLALSDLWLDHVPLTTLDSRYVLLVKNLSFDNVSPNFILAFAECVILSPHMQFVSFRNCSIPSIQHGTGLSASHKLLLELVDIPFEAPGTLLTRDNSICNALEALPPAHLRVLRCPGFDDTILDWIMGNTRDEGLTALTLHDCPAFTSRGVLRLLAARLRTSFDSGTEKPRILEVEVGGRGPALKKKSHAQWIADGGGTGREARVRWSVEHAEGGGVEGVTEFRSVGEEDTAMWDRTTWGVFPVHL